jgi:hypothetical protein
MLAATTTVRVSPETRAELTELAAERGVTTADLIAELLAFERERSLLRAMNDGFARLAEDSAAMAAWRAEQRAWDATLGDGFA